MNIRHITKFRQFQQRRVSSQREIKILQPHQHIASMQHYLTHPCFMVKLNQRHCSWSSWTCCPCPRCSRTSRPQQRPRQRRGRPRPSCSSRGLRRGPSETPFEVTVRSDSDLPLRFLCAADMDLCKILDTLLDFALIRQLLLFLFLLLLCASRSQDSGVAENPCKILLTKSLCQISLIKVTIKNIAKIIINSRKA